jgi:hypothetical protein
MHHIPFALQGQLFIVQLIGTYLSLTLCTLVLDANQHILQ